MPRTIRMRIGSFRGGVANVAGVYSDTTRLLLRRPIDLIVRHVVCQTLFRLDFGDGRSQRSLTMVHMSYGAHIAVWPVTLLRVCPQFGIFVNTCRIRT